MRGNLFGRGLVAAAITTALLAPAPALAQQPGYDENQNWLNAYGRTVDHFSAPTRSLGNVLISAKAIVDTVTLETGRIPDRGVQQFGAWPWNGDPECGSYRVPGSHEGVRREFLFTNRSGQQLKATLYAPPGKATMSADGQTFTVSGDPIPGLVYSGGVISAEPMYCWFAHGMAKAGYFTMTYDVSGQGKSDGSSTGDAVSDLKDALDFFASTPSSPYEHAADGDDFQFNPLHALLDRDRIGDAGHSMGAGAVQAVGSHGGLVKAISAHSDLGFGRGPEGDTTPIQGQGADYESFIFPPQPEPDADENAKLDGFNAIREATPGRDVMEVVIESGSHMAWSHVTWAYTASWSETVAFHYSLAWFDRYLMDDLVRGGKTATQRLTENLQADAAGHGVSKKYLSAYHLADGNGGFWDCGDMVGRQGCTAP